MYYTGPGVLSSGGKDYGSSDKLPDGLSKELIDSLRKKGRISDVPPVAKKGRSAEPSINVNDLAEINKQLQEHLQVVEKLLDESRKNIESRDQQIAEANKTIEILTEQLTATAMSAGPTKKKQG